MMGLTLSASFMARGLPCLSYDSTPGKEVSAPRGLRYCNGRVVFERLPADASVLVDACDLFRVKVLDPDTTLLLLNNEHELNDVEPVLDDLRARKIIVVEPIDRVDKVAIKDTLCKSFYDSGGALINSQFALPGLSPEEMAEAGFGFSGDASDDSVKCHHDASHVLANWRSGDHPVEKHVVSYSCRCFDQPSYHLPFLSDDKGNDITGHMYQVIDRTNTSIYCRRALVLVRRDLPVNKATLKTLELDIDVLHLNKVERSLNRKEGACLIDEEYFALRKQLLVVGHFTRLLRTFKWLREEYVDLLMCYKKRLQMAEQVAVAERTAVSLLACSVDKEINEVVSAVVELDKAQWQEAKQKHAGRHAHRSFWSARSKRDGVSNLQVRKGAETVLAVLAEVYADNFFRDVFLNELVETGRLGCLFSDGYFKSTTRDEVLLQLLEKGTDLTRVLADIAENLQALTDPFYRTINPKNRNVPA